MTGTGKGTRRRSRSHSRATQAQTEIEETASTTSEPTPEPTLVAEMQLPVPEAAAEDPDMVSDLVPELSPMFPDETPFLARFLPQGVPTFQGLRAPFCELDSFLRYLHGLGWFGFVRVHAPERAGAYVLIFEGRTVTAAAGALTGEQALGEMLRLYEEGGQLDAYELPQQYVHVLSGVGSRAWKFKLTEDFTGLHARATGAIFYAGGEPIATMPATLPYEGAFPAPLRPQTLILPRSLAGWAHYNYTLTLRGRDALSAITDVHQAFRQKHGTEGVQFLRALGSKLSAAEYAQREEVSLHELEQMLSDFVKSGYLRED